MPRISKSIADMQGIAFVGNYLPRACGIATFTYDLAEAAARIVGEEEVVALAMSDEAERYTYPSRVKFEIRQNVPGDYEEAAHCINSSSVEIVSLQHEYGIFGGDYGSHVLLFLEKLKKPVVLTCHTVYKKPTSVHKEILIEASARASKVVAMSRTSIEFLQKIYGVSEQKIEFIPHGIHDVPFLEPDYYKKEFGVTGWVLLTFGLLHRKKGIEYVIEALPSIIRKHPRTTYVILGATHPKVAMMEGETYRMKLQSKVRALGLEKHVKFFPRFVHLQELLRYLAATDIFVTPYLTKEYAVSGALAYALSSGKAVVSTPYWYARELLAEGRGRLVPMRNPKALADEIIGLMEDKDSLFRMRKRAYDYCRVMTWPRVALSYVELFNKILGYPQKRAGAREIALQRFEAGTARGS